MIDNLDQLENVLQNQTTYEHAWSTRDKSVLIEFPPTSSPSQLNNNAEVLDVDPPNIVGISEIKVTKSKMNVVAGTVSSRGTTSEFKDNKSNNLMFVTDYSQMNWLQPKEQTH